MTATLALPKPHTPLYSGRQRLSNKLCRQIPPYSPPPLGEGWGEGRAACATAGAAPIPAFPQLAKSPQRRGGAHSTRILLSLMTLPHLSNSAVT